jgi:hypothetical protein
MTVGRINLSVAEARDLAEGALRGIGFDNDEARIVADHVIDAALCGYEYSGLPKVLNLPESQRFKLPRRSSCLPPRFSPQANQYRGRTPNEHGESARRYSCPFQAALCGAQVRSFLHV